MENPMSFFISDVYAQATPAAGQAPNPMSWIFLAVMFGALYFILIRPQQKRVKEHRAMVTTLSKGDEVVTNGGLLGRITKVGDSFITLEIAQGVEVTVQKQAVASLMPKGTIKSV